MARSMMVGGGSGTLVGVALVVGAVTWGLGLAAASVAIADEAASNRNEPSARPMEPLKAGDHVREVIAPAPELAKPDDQANPKDKDAPAAPAPTRKRTYRLHVPPRFDPNQPTTVVFVLHPFGVDVNLWIVLCGFNSKADEGNFLAVYPGGLGLIPSWNAGGIKGLAVDDVGYIREVLADLHSIARIDPKRIFSTGMSNGGMMSYRLAAEMSDTFAAIAPVGGTLCLAPETIQLKSPVSVLHIHGTKDNIVPYNGLGNAPRIMSYDSVDGSIQPFLKANGCPNSATETPVPDKADDGTTTTIIRYPPGRDGAVVELYKVDGGGHTWPGRSFTDIRQAGNGNGNGTVSSTSARLGRTAQDFRANDVIWEFFQKHPKP